MISGIYTAGSGMISRSKNIDIISNNIVNANTTGYKKDGMITSTFDDYMGYKIGENGGEEIGVMTRGTTPGDVYTSYEQGSMEPTGRSLDLAITGEGFFTLMLTDGTTALTRNGQFMLNEKGYLVDTEGSFVLGNNGPIQIGRADFEVSSNGNITVNGASVDTLRITCPASTDALVKLSDSMFVDPNGTNAVTFTGKIRQGALEGSNTNVTEEMADILAQQRGYQSCSQIIKMMDQILQKSVHELGRV
jgi:flagellar basal-body rod protein FlgG